MAISLTCPECSETFAVKDALEGKRVRCKHCQTAVRVTRGDEFDDEDVVSSSSDFDELPDSKTSKRSKKSQQNSEPNVAVRFLAYIVRNPWVAMVLLFVVFWIPLSFIYPREFAIADGIIFVLAMLGCFVSTVAAFIGVTVKNPFEIFIALTAGALLSQIAPAQVAGRATGKMMNKAGVKNIGDLETGAAGRMVAYCGIVAIVFLAHAVGACFLYVGRLPQ